MPDSDSSESLTSMFICPVSVSPRAHLRAADSSPLLRKCYVQYIWTAEEVTYHPGLVMVELRHTAAQEQGGEMETEIK